MADAATATMRRGLDEEGTELLLVESGERERERSWRLNFDGLRLSERREEPPPRRLHDCLGALGSFFPFFLSPYNTLGFDVLFLLHIYTYVNIAFILLSSVFRHCLCLEQLPTVSSNCVFCLCLSFCVGKVEFLIGSSSVELFGRSDEQLLLG